MPTALESQPYELSPCSPEAYQNLFGIGASQFLLGNYEAAIEWSLKSLATFNDLIYTYVCLTCCYAALDLIDDARAMARRVRQINPAMTIQVIKDGATGKEDAFAVGIIPWLRLQCRQSSLSWRLRQTLCSITNSAAAS